MRAGGRLAAGLLGLVGAGCAAERPQEGLRVRPPMPDPELARGEALFMRHCQKCHPGGEAGLGPAINPLPAPAPVVAFQIRNGLGAMPSFDEDLLPDPDLDAVVEFVLALREHAD